MSVCNNVTQVTPGTRNFLPVPGHLSIDGASAKSAPFGGGNTAEGASSIGWENFQELPICRGRMGGVL